MLVCLFACVLASGCQSDERYCKLEETQVVAQTAAKEIDAIAIEALPTSADVHDAVVLAWSDSAGLSARVLDADGKPIGETARLGERCTGGIALLSRRVRRKPDPGKAASVDTQLACSRRGVPRDATSTGHVQVYALEARRDTAGVHVMATEMARYEPVGTLSEGVSIVALGPGKPASTERDRYALAWHDASPDMHRVWLVRAAAVTGGAPGAPKVVSTLGRMAESPSLIALGGETLLAWSERYASERSGDTGPQTSIMLARGDRPPQVVRERAHVSATPLLAQLGAGAVLGFRELGGGGRKVGLFLADLKLAHLEGGGAGAGRPMRAGEPVRVGRAEGVGKPAVVPCMSGLVTATPRSYSGDYFIGINWLSPSLTRPRREQQFYEDAHAFTHVATVCLPAREDPRAKSSRALIALAELPPLERLDGPKLADLHIARYACED